MRAAGMFAVHFRLGLTSLAAQGNKRAMNRLTEMKRLGSKCTGVVARPTRQQAKDECITEVRLRHREIRHIGAGTFVSSESTDELIQVTCDLVSEYSNALHIYMS